MRLARHTVSTRGQLAGSSGSSQAKPSLPSVSREATHSSGSRPLSRTARPRSSGLAENVGADGIQPSRADWATRSAVCRPANRPFPAAGEASASALWAS